MSAPWLPQNPGIGGLKQLTSTELAVVQNIAALPDPNADRILFWDDSLGAYAYLIPGAGLSITDDTINVTGSGTAWGAITGLLSDQLDLQSALDLKAPLASPTFTGTVSLPTPFNLGGVSVTTTAARLNYLASAGGTTGTVSTNLVFSTSPALTTPTVVTSIVGGATFAAFNTVTTNLSLGGAATTLNIGGTPTTAITHNYSANATATGVTKTINFATGGAAGSTTNVNLGSAVGGTFTINSPIMAVGTTNITMTGALAATGARVSKGWFTDVESTNMYTVGGNSLSSIFSAVAGSTSIVTLGTVTTGTWNASVIAGQYGGTGVANTGKTITIGGNFVTSGAFAVTLTVTAATNVTLPTTGTLSTLAGVETFTNKRITPRIGTIASSATPTPDADSHDEYTVTALAAGATFGAPTGTPTDGQKLIIRVKDNATARTLAYNAIYRAIGVTLPTTTVISKTLYLGMIYNSADTKWDVVAVAQEA